MWVYHEGLFGGKHRQNVWKHHSNPERWAWDYRSEQYDIKHSWRSCWSREAFVPLKKKSWKYSMYFKEVVLFKNANLEDRTVVLRQYSIGTHSIHAEVGRLKQTKRTICKSDSPYSTYMIKTRTVHQKYTKWRKQDNFHIKYINYFFSHVFLIWK